VVASLPPRPLAALAAVADRLARGRVDWLLAGSAARALLGYRVRPADIDIEVSPAHAEAAARLLGAPLAVASGAGRRSRRGSARLADVEVDLTCDLAVAGATHTLDPDFARQWEHSRRLWVCGREIRAAPVEETLARALVLGDWTRLARVAAEAAPWGAPLRPDYVALRLSSATSRATR
jgi:Aminoglycoside-2''-adenylyltransferase